MAADYAQPELTEFRQKIDMLTCRGVDLMAAKRMVASDRIAKSDRKSRGLAVYNDVPADVEPVVDSRTMRKHWRELCSMVRHYDESLAPLLMSCGVVEVHGDSVTLGTHVHRVFERLKRSDQGATIARALHDLWQHDFQVNVVWAERAFWLDERWLHDR
jgi:hypothetical protein